MPIALNIAHRRTLHNITVNFSRTSSSAINRYANVVDVAGDAGITGVSTDPFDWGVPELSFCSMSSVRDLDPSRRTDRGSPRPTRGRGRLAGTRCGSAATTAGTPRTTGPTRMRAVDSSSPGSTRPAEPRPMRAAAASISPTSCSACRSRPAVQYGPGNVKLHGRSMSLFVQDDWRKSATLTFNLGRPLRAALALHRRQRPDGQSRRDSRLHRGRARLSPAEPVRSPDSFPSALLAADTNNIAPRVGFAWRIKPATILRGGYGLTFNAGSYSNDRAADGRAAAVRGHQHRRSVIARRSSASPIRSQPPPADETTNNLRRAARLRARHGPDAGTPTSRAICGRSGTSAPATPIPAARASTSCARRIAIRTACASRACSRFSGRRRKGRRCCTPATFRVRSAGQSRASAAA